MVPLSSLNTAVSELTRQTVLKHGWNTTCYQIVNPGMLHWHSEGAAVGFVRKGKVRVVAGAPVCPVEALPDVVKQFESGGEVVYFGAEERLKEFASSTQRYAISVMGGQPVWEPQSWIRAADGDASLRAQFNRSRNKGVVVKEWSPEVADVPTLRRVLNEWLETRGLPPMHFLIEPDTLANLADRRVFVAIREEEVIGFTTLSPIPERNGWLTEQFVRGHKATNGTIEMLIDFAIRTVAREGAEMVTMGMVPLSRKVAWNCDDPLWLRFTMNWVRAHGRRFYNFDGLEWFKDKFHPDRWDPIYVISTVKPFPAKHLYAVAAAFTGMSPVKAIAKGAWKAVRQEAAWATGR